MTSKRKTLNSAKSNTGTTSKSPSRVMSATTGTANKENAASSKVTVHSMKNCYEDIDARGEIPLARFGHTITLISKTAAIMFGGATGDTGRFSMTGDTFIFNLQTNVWKKLNGKI